MSFPARAPFHEDGCDSPLDQLLDDRLLDDGPLHRPWTHYRVYGRTQAVLADVGDGTRKESTMADGGLRIKLRYCVP